MGISYYDNTVQPAIQWATENNLNPFLKKKTTHFTYSCFCLLVYYDKWIYAAYAKVRFIVS